MTSPVTDMVEGFQDQRMDPRTRMFMYEMWCTTTCQTVDDVYRGTQPKETYRIDAYRGRIAALQQALDAALEEQAKKKKKHSK